jgi:hypothetical protein
MDEYVATTANVTKKTGQAIHTGDASSSSSSFMQTLFLRKLLCSLLLCDYCYSRIGCQFHAASVYEMIVVGRRNPTALTMLQC